MLGPEVTLLGTRLGAASSAAAPAAPALGFARPGDLAETPVPPRAGHRWHMDAQQLMPPASRSTSATRLQEGTMPVPCQGWPASLPVATTHRLDIQDSL